MSFQKIIEVFEIGARFFTESAPTMFISATVVEVRPVLYPEIGVPMHVERAIAAELMCILSSASEMSLLSVVICEISCCMFGSQSFQEVFNVTTLPPVIVLSFHSSATEEFDHEALWLAFVIKGCNFGSIVSPASLCFSFSIRTLAYLGTRSV